MFQNKVALVTGAASGIGRATAIAFATSNAKVVVVDRNQKLGKETAELICNKGGDALFLHVDVSKASEVENMVNQTLQHYGRLVLLWVVYCVWMADYLLSSNQLNSVSSNSSYWK